MIEVIKSKDMQDAKKQKREYPLSEPIVSLPFKTIILLVLS
jgi:hypothetical protein